MQLFGVSGPGSGTLVDAIVDRLSGRVAVVRDASTDGGAVAAPTGATIYERGEDGWRAAGETGSLTDVVDRLAPDHDYAVLVDVEARVPTVALGDADPVDVLRRARDPGAIDLGELESAVDALEPHETLGSLVARVKQSDDADRAGAVATFTGRVRARDAAADVPTEYLEFETYEGIADDRMAAIAEELEAREEVYEVALHHRTGVVEAGEDIVFVVVLAGHRAEAFDAVQDGIDRLKAEVPIFKREVTAEETFWVHER